VTGLDITRLLHAWRDGDQGVLDQLLPWVYDELRRIARQHMRRERPDHTLQPTALVNEAYLRLMDARKIDWRDRTHFFALASRVMRRVLVDAARTRLADKRGAGAPRAKLDDVLDAVADGGVDLTALDDALGALETAHPRKARVVELRFFGGLGADEIAEVLGVSAYTVTRDWTFAKSWLKAELSTPQKLPARRPSG
jgi:RNA polymerase sigma factor (TIGR02999 family)